MKPRTPTPLKRGDTVRRGIAGHTIWTVKHVTGKGWEIHSPAGVVHIITPDTLDTLRRVNGVPIAYTVLRQRMHDMPGALSLDDLVRYDSSTGNVRTRKTWVVRYLDEDVIEISSGRSTRYHTWLDIERGRLVRANGLPIPLPNGHDHG